ncbi:MAG: hypothetical protein QM687_09195 [Ferruginibacter sp.]
MSVVSRRFAASPARTAAEVWQVIVNIIAADNAAVKQQLNDITGIVASIISDETPANNPITIIGAGPRLRVYCLFGDDAIGDDANEAALTWNPFEKSWEAYFPVEEADYDWVSKLLKEKSTQFKAYKAGEKIKAEENEDDVKTESGFNQLSINLDKLK